MPSQKRISDFVLPSTQGIKVGILGGGQLARMLAQAGSNWGLEVHILSPDKNDPAAQVTNRHYLGSAEKINDLVNFIKSVDFLTFESEFIDIPKLQAALLKTKNAPRVFPDLNLMQSLQDRRTQKKLLEKHKIPTARFIEIENSAQLSQTLLEFPKGFVLKKARGGYDGYGTFFVKNQKDLNKLLNKFPDPCIAESFIEFQNELAVIAVCDHKNIQFFPLVQSKQTNSKCDWVIGPMKNKHWPKMQKKLSIFLKKINYRGVIAFEFFETKDSLLVNEIAPRVHNSGHYSMDAMVFSQFDLHLLAGLSDLYPTLMPKKLPSLVTKSFAMLNLISNGSKPFIFPKTLNGQFYWYGKDKCRPGRKMGHINWVGNESATSLLKIALQHRNRIINEKD